jgi:ribonuclease BN (tRNA processing enzyme)
MEPSELAGVLLSRERRVLLYGPPGIGKSTLAAQLAGTATADGSDVSCISADPGSPAFGIPGALSLGRWHGDHWQVRGFEALCTLDAGRFRLPLILAVQRLAQQVTSGTLLVDGPGVVRGVAGRELLQGLIAAAAIDTVLVLGAADRRPVLEDELQSLSVQTLWVRAADQARRPGKRLRARVRTGQWDDYLAAGRTQQIDLTPVTLLGTPPPPGVAAAWLGRQVALLRDGATIVMGEVIECEGNRALLRLPAETPVFDAMLVRDALRNTQGLVETAEGFGGGPVQYRPPPDMSLPVEERGGPRVMARVGPLDVVLLNGVFGDPLLHLRLRHRRRSILFDLGEGVRLAARTAHQITDVFISHAHMDHIGAFSWLLRSRLGEIPPCRLYGPPGLADHIQGLIHGYLWDRIGEMGPSFEVAEVHGDRVRRFQLQAGQPGCHSLGEGRLVDGVLLDEVDFRVRAVTLDHLTPVLAFAFEPARQINIRKDRLRQRGLDPGPWLTALKRHLMAGEEGTVVALPDGGSATAAELGRELAIILPAKRLVYATDLADTEDNRQRLIALARHAHTFFCEAPFLYGDADRAQRTGHLTTRACGEIAEAAGVARLVPFHFSRRYVDDPQAIYEEIKEACSRVVVPGSMALFDADAPAVNLG